MKTERQEPRMPKPGRHMWLVALLTVGAMLASCSKQDDAAADRLPEGKYPLTFTASVDGLIAEKAATRATVDDSWAGGEKIAVQVGNEVKQYKVTDATTGAMSADDGVTPFYWQTTAETKTVSAWYPYSTTRPTNFTVQKDQDANNGAGYQQSDFIYAAPATISYGGSKVLTFKHLPVKVVVNLKADTQNGVTGDEVKKATVILQNQALTSGKITYDANTGAATVAKANSGLQFIIAKANTTPTVGYQKTVQALTIPLQMKDKLFFRVTIGEGHYYYTPKNDTDANLEAGKQYTYNITVKRTGLSATVTVSDWDNTPGTVNPDAGMGDDVRKPLDQAVVGDFYCKDGFGAYLIPKDVTELTDEQKAACIGIVMKVGRDADGSQKDDCVYTTKGGGEMSTIHGYVLALYDANNGKTCEWGSNGTQVDHTDMNREQNTGFYGYKNTQAIKSFNNDANTLQEKFPAAYWASVDYETRESGKYAAPANSSGWFLPSAGQCKYWLNNKEQLLTQVQKATGATNYNWKSFYWSSSEYAPNPSDYTWYLSFDFGYVDDYYKRNRNYVRSCLAF